MDVPAAQMMGEIAQFAGVPNDETVIVDFDFSVLKDIPMCMKLDVGASAYWSEIASVQTLDNLLMQDKIDLADYLERIPEGYISKRAELLAKYGAPKIPEMPGMAQGDMNKRIQYICIVGELCKAILLEKARKRYVRCR